ncbi:class II aldolase/adducin family protein [Actinomadura sp. ATCC 31491]|uniref:Class II aldolase/adducin family protein n=1 Tax=Actinomadura luzonensis TaxID=2805427 RepID=A0ABT0FVS0_9ACTN|nr:class II aldolase/adducin family protein [Actinomadura luzonensis]MCK2216075.1 class II aldolase/adducin family protein [Actinomadura luzonensis]
MHTEPDGETARAEAAPGMPSTPGQRVATEPAGAERAVVELVAAGRALAGAGLVTAFGHVSVRIAPDRLLMTPPSPLGTLTPASPYAEIPLDANDLPAGAPREAWIHVELARARPGAGAICRAQPPVATALAAAGVPIRPLHGQGAFLGPEVPVFDDAVLVRDRERGRALAERLGAAPAVILRGNGAVTVGATAGETVALMWVLEASARMNATAWSVTTPKTATPKTATPKKVAPEAAAPKTVGPALAGPVPAGPGPAGPVPLSPAEQEAWRAAQPELLARVWAYLQEPS